MSNDVMKGLELSFKYYSQFGAAMIHDRFADYEPRIACGLVGDGSECFGFDDEISRDHDFGPGFCLWLTDEDYETVGEELAGAYASLPSEFMGYAARPVTSYGDQRIGVMRISDFYRRYTGCRETPQTLFEWRAIPETFLAVATNGRVFSDPSGRFTQIRDDLLNFYPEDVRLKKLAARLGVMGQAGQYNLPRSLSRHELVAAEFAKAEFMKAACSCVYLLNKRYMPFYKWAHRGLRLIDKLPEVYGLLDRLVAADFDNGRGDGRGDQDVQINGRGDQAGQTNDSVVDIVTEICGLVSGECQVQGLTASAGDTFLLTSAHEVLALVQDEQLKKLHLFSERLE
jgi:hypothetical protein